MSLLLNCKRYFLCRALSIYRDMWLAREKAGNFNALNGNKK